MAIYIQGATSSKASLWVSIFVLGGVSQKETVGFNGRRFFTKTSGRCYVYEHQLPPFFFHRADLIEGIPDGPQPNMHILKHFVAICL